MWCSRIPIDGMKDENGTLTSFVWEITVLLLFIFFFSIGAFELRRLVSFSLYEDEDYYSIVQLCNCGMFLLVYYAGMMHVFILHSSQAACVMVFPWIMLSGHNKHFTTHIFSNHCNSHIKKRGGVDRETICL